jgi:hypothetical protein
MTDFHRKSPWEGWLGKAVEALFEENTQVSTEQRAADSGFGEREVVPGRWEQGPGYSHISGEW